MFFEIKFFFNEWIIIIIIGSSDYLWINCKKVIWNIDQVSYAGYHIVDDKIKEPSNNIKRDWALPFKNKSYANPFKDVHEFYEEKDIWIGRFYMTTFSDFNSHFFFFLLLLFLI